MDVGEHQKIRRPRCPRSKELQAIQKCRPIERDAIPPSLIGPIVQGPGFPVIEIHRPEDQHPAPSHILQAPDHLLGIGVAHVYGHPSILSFGNLIYPL
jgi:hypothetical protein